MTDAPLLGRTIGVTADRRAADQIEMLERRGATVMHGPTLGTAFLGDEQRLRTVTTALIADPPDVLVANTGVGVRTWFDAADSWGVRDELLAALTGCAVVARGPKAAGAVRRAGLAVAASARSERLQEVGDLVLGLGLRGKRVVLQEHGEESVALRERFVDAGAEVLQLPVYRWRLPEDTASALALIEAVCARRVDAVTFTSAPAARNLVVLAADAGRDRDLLAAFNDDGGVAAICVGPVCADAARDVGIDRVVAPEVGRLGSMIRVVVEVLDGREVDSHPGGAGGS